MGALLLALALAGASGCAGTSASAPSPSGTGAGGSGIGDGLGGGGVLPPGGTGGAVVEPERELDGAYQAPVATGRFVWIANPASGHVAYVDAASLAVKTVEAGDAPTTVAALPDPAGGDQVIVLNQLSRDATVLRADGAGGPPASRTVPGVVAGANRVAVSPRGRFAIAWIDGRAQANARPTDGFQSITVIDLGAPAAAADAGGSGSAAPAVHVNLAVGFRPVSIGFAADERRAFAVTEDGVSIIALDGASGPRIAGNLALGDDPTASADTRDVSISADGRWAAVRREGSDGVSLVDLGTGAITTVRLSGPVTDLDLTPDSARVLAVVRATGEVALIPLGAAPPISGAIIHLTITGETIGQAVLTDDGATAVLYSNAVAAQRLTVLSLGATPTWRTLRVHAPVLSVVLAPDGRGAVVLHPAEATGAGGAAGADAGAAPDGGAAASDAGAPVEAPAVGAFSLLTLDGTQPAFIQATGAPLRALAFSPGGDRALLTVRDDRAGVFAVYLALFPTLEVQRYPLASPPIAAGVAAAARRGYVAQQHPEGRITFLTLDSGEARTLTGYELGARVVDWSRP